MCFYSVKKAQREVLDTLMNRAPASRSKYSPETRQFCLRLQFHSTAAYEELRAFFGKRLPTVRTLRKWLACTDASPGITKSAIDEIAKKVAICNENGEDLLLCLISDEISIRKQVNWDSNNQRFDGFPTVVNSKPNPKTKSVLPVAKDALVFMIAGPNFKIPVAYFLLAGLQAVDRAAITREVVISIQNTGAKVVSMTGDGLHANISVAKLLGANFNSNRTYFSTANRPNEKIYIILDPPHMLKLLRKYFATGKLSYKNSTLKWELLELLAKKQDSDNFGLGNQLSRDHINFNEAPMKVSLAVQTFSNSVADALEQLCEDQYEDFIGCEPTIKFIRLCNNVYDVMNCSHGKPGDDHFKIPLCEKNIGKLQELFHEFEEFVSHMTIDEYKSKKNKGAPMRKPVLKSRSSVGFFGLLTNIKSVLGIYSDYVKSGVLDEFYTFQFSQDHLETYFSLIRAALGANNNPNEAQFKGAYRKLLVCMPHLSARHTNCILSSSNVLTVTSGVQPEKKPAILQSSQFKAIEFDEVSFYYMLEAEDEPYVQHLRAFIASEIESKIFKRIKAQSKIACQNCLNVFDENVKIFDAFINKKGRTKQQNQPCSSTVYILSCCDVLFELLQSKDYVDVNVMARSAFSMIPVDEMYISTSFDVHKDPSSAEYSFTHKDKFIFDVVFEYMNMKSNKIGKRITIEDQNCRAIRRKLTRNIILAGQ